MEWLEPKVKPFLFLDEIHLVTGLEKFARSLHERKEANLFVSGSSAKLSNKGFGSALTGRHVGLLVYPLSFKEFLLFRGVEVQPKPELAPTRERSAIARLLREHIEWGSFPQVALAGEKREVLIRYFDDVISRDIVDRYGIRKPYMLKSLARYYLTCMASPISFNKIKHSA